MTERPGDVLPAGWTLSTLAKLIIPGTRITYGIVQPGSEDPLGTLLVRGGDIRDGHIQTRQLRTISMAIAQSSPKTLLRGGELLMSLVGYPGEVALVPAELAGANIARQVACIRLDEQVDSAYVMQYLRSDAGRHQLFQKAAGSAQQVINLSDLNQVSVTIAPLRDQRKIAALLQLIDDLSKATQQKITRLKNLRIGMIQELLNGRADHQARQPSPIGYIPENWAIATLGQVTQSLQTGPFGSLLHAHEYVPAGVPVVMPRDMKEQIIDTTAIAHITPERAEQLARFQIQPGDILFSRRGDIARSVLVHPENAGWLCGTGCLRARLGQRILPEFFISYLMQPNVIERLHNHAVGQTMPSLNRAILSELPVVLPPLEEQQVIAATMQSLNKVLLIHESKLRQLGHTKKSLMQAIFSGSLRIS